MDYLTKIKVSFRGQEYDAVIDKINAHFIDNDSTDIGVMMSSKDTRFPGGQGFGILFTIEPREYSAVELVEEIKRKAQIHLEKMIAHEEARKVKLKKRQKIIDLSRRLSDVIQGREEKT